jgi:glycerophosphoryl diester phosphodiesterase
VTLQLTGTRVDTGGPTYKRLETATDDNYTLTDFVAKNYLGLVSVERRASTVKNVTITNGRVYNIDRVFVLPYDDAELDGALFQDLDCYDLERGFMRLKRARNVTLRRIIARQRASGTTQFADAFATSDLPTLNIKFEDVQCIGFDMIVPAGAYPNGGAFSDEELSVNTSYLRCLAKDGNDGWDLKGGDTAVACRSQNNHRNWRLWGSTTITDCWSVGASNAFFWFGGGSRLGACKLVRPRIVDSGSTAPWFKVDTHTSAASITIVDPLDGNGNLIPEATILSRFQWDAPKLMTVTVQYTGATSFPAVDTTPRPPIITAGGPVTPDPPADVTIAPPTDVKLTYDTGTGRATLTWTPPSGATAVEVFERTNTPVVALGSYPAGTNLRVSTVLKVPGEYTFSVVAVFADGRRSIEVPADPASLVLPLTIPPVDGGGGPPPVDPPPDNPPGETPDPPADIHGLVTITRNGVRKVYRVLGQSQTPTGPGDTGGGGVPAPPGTAPTWAQTKALAKSSGKPIIIAHRGGGGEIAKNNALSAIDQDLALGMGTDDHMIPDGGDHWVGADGGLYNSHDSTTGAYMNQDMTVSSATAASWAALRMKDFPTYRGTISNEAPPTSRQTLERIKAIGKFTVPEDKDHSSSSRAKLRDLILDLGMQNSVQVQSFQAADLGPAKTAGMSVGLLQNSSANIGATAILTCVNGSPPDLVLYDPRTAPGNSDTWVKAMIDAGIALQVGTFSRRYDLDKEKIRVANLGGNITFVPADNPFYIARKNTPLAADRWDTQYWEHGQIPSDTSTEPQIQSTGKLKFANATASQWTLLGGFADETQGCWTICEFDVTFDALDTTTSRWIGLEWALADDRNFHDGTDNGVGSLAMRFRQTGQIQLYNRTSNTLSTMVADNVTAVGTTSSTTLTPITAGQTIRVRVENLTDSSGAFTGQARVTRMDTGQWVMTAVGDAPVRGPYMHLGKNGTTGSVISVANLAVTYSATAAPPPVVTPPVEVTQVTPLDDAMVVYETDAGSGPQSVFTVPRPTDGGPLAAGDLLLFSFSIDVPATAPTLAAFTSVPAGATALVPGTLITGSSTSLLGAAVYTKIVTSAEAATPPASWSFTLGASYDGSASVVRFRGVDATSPFTVSTGNVAVATTTSTGVAMRLRTPRRPPPGHLPRLCGASRRVVSVSCGRPRCVVPAPPPPRRRPRPLPCRRSLSGSCPR